MVDNHLHQSLRVVVKILELVICQQNYHPSSFYLSPSVTMMVGWGVRHMVALWQCIKEEQNLVET
jgi:hypothetical protein